MSFTDNPALAGNKKNYRLHELKTPAALTGSAPQIEEKCLLYPIVIKPSFTPPKNDDNIQLFHQLFESENTFGIVISKRLPRLAAMKFFQTFGAIGCVIGDTPLEVTIPPADMRKLQQFHITLFRDVLETWHDFVVYDTTDSFTIAPINNTGILWNIVNEFQSLIPISEKSESERANLKYNRDDWLHRVICPWYRADRDVRYIVTKIHEHLTPFSEFPNQTHETYADYVQDKYHVKPVQREQFMIEVKGVTRKLNRLLPGDGEDGKKTNAIRGPELLIPELCHNFSFPGDLWIKATVLPSALHRMHYLLHAEQIRVDINRYLGLNVIDYQPLPVMEKMNRRPKRDGQEKRPQISVARSDTGNAAPRVLSDHAPLSETFDCPWIDSEEPIDLSRNLDGIYPLEIDYYHIFINKFNRLAVIDEGDEGQEALRKALSPTRYRAKPSAICDTPLVEKKRISLLGINEHSPGRGIEQHELLAAITASSSADVFDMERLEVLGDAFLKFGVSLYLIQKHTNWHEGFLTSIKGKIVSNRNLCYNAIKMKLPGLIKINQFCPKDDWLPPMTRVPEFVEVNLGSIKYNIHEALGN